MDKNNILEQINTSGLKLLASVSPEQLCPTIVEEAKKLVDAKHGSMYLLNEDKFVLAYTSSPLLSDIKIQKKGYIKKAAQMPTITIIHSDEIKKRQPQIAATGINSIITIPLSYKTETIGVLVLYALENEYFTEKESDILKLYGGMASFALIKTRLHEEAKSALELRDRFISLASHELRTPLTSLNGYIQLLHNRLANKNTVESRWVEELFHESIRLTNLVKELLHINRITQGQLSFIYNEISLQKVVNTVIHQYHITHPNYPIILKNKNETEKYIVIGDEARLQEMVSGIIDNAIKFSDPNSPIHIAISEMTRTIHLSVKDHGRGLEKKNLDEILKGFYNPKDAVYNEGMGIGLLVAKHVVQNHRGKIYLTSKANKGTTVKVTLPKAKI